jgi:hypothetical protein
MYSAFTHSSCGNASFAAISVLRKISFNVAIFCYFLTPANAEAGSFAAKQRRH